MLERFEKITDREYYHLWFCVFCTILLYIHQAAFPPFGEWITISLLKCLMKWLACAVWGEQDLRKIIYLQAWVVYSLQWIVYIQEICGTMSNWENRLIYSISVSSRDLGDRVVRILLFFLIHFLFWNIFHVLFIFIFNISLYPSPNFPCCSSYTLS